MAQRLFAALAVALAASSCSLLELEGLRAGGSGGGASASSTGSNPPATTSTGSTTVASSTTATTGSAAGGGEGGTGSMSSSSTGDGGGGEGGGNACAEDAFPCTPLRDDFEEGDGQGPLSASWSGGADEYMRVDGALRPTSENPGIPALWDTPFTADQEAFAILREVPADYREIILVLGAQNTSNHCDLIEALYSPSDLRFEIWTCVINVTGGENWTLVATFSHPVPEPGDQLGARRRGNQVQMLLNGAATTVWTTVPDFEHAPGRIGLSFLRGSGTGVLAFEDFGGGSR